MNGILYIAQGPEPHPTVVLLHGFPGNERNLDLAQAIRRAGWNVLAFHYRGAWGSEGPFSFSNALRDVSAAVQFTHNAALSPNNRIDSHRIVLVGHSFGGFLALSAAARDSSIAAVASIAGWNPAAAVRRWLAGAGSDSVARRWDQQVGPLRGTSGRAIVQEVLEHHEDWDLLKVAPALSQKPLLLVAGARDAVTPLEEHHRPLVHALERENAAGLTHLVLDTDHVFSDRRIALSKAVVKWLASVP